MSVAVFQYTLCTPPPNETLQQKKLRHREAFKMRRLEHKLRLFQEAVSLACSREFTADPVTWVASFSISFPTQFGQDLYLVGSCPELGSWDSEKAIPMTWGPDNLWTISVPLSRSHSVVEYKYLVKQHGETNWEWGHNHSVRFDQDASRHCVFDSWGSGGQ